MSRYPRSLRNLSHLVVNEHIRVRESINTLEKAVNESLKHNDMSHPGMTVAEMREYTSNVRKFGYARANQILSEQGSERDDDVHSTEFVVGPISEDLDNHEAWTHEPPKVQVAQSEPLVEVKETVLDALAPNLDLFKSSMTE